MEDIYSAMVPMISVSSWFGLSPFKLKGDVGNRTLELSKSGVSYNFLLIVYLTLVYLATWYLNWWRSNSTLTDILHVFHSSIDILICLTAIFLSCTNGRKAIRVVQSVAQIDREFESRGEEMPYKISKKYVIYQIGLFIFFLASKLCLFLYRTIKSKRAGYQFYLAWVVYISHQLPICFLVFIYIDCLWLLQLRFKFINKYFVAIARDHTDARNIRKKMFQYMKDSKLSPLSITSVAAFHDKLCDCALEFNSMFAIQVLLFTISALMNILGETTYYISWLVLKPKVDDFIISTALILTIIYQLLSIVRASILTSAEANYTAVVLHKLMLYPAGGFDLCTMRQLEVFSIQLLHRKLHFCAWGFYRLDATLLCSVVGGVFTYMVILIQFKLISTQGAR